MRFLETAFYHNHVKEIDEVGSTYFEGLYHSYDLELKYEEYKATYEKLGTASGWDTFGVIEDEYSELYPQMLCGGIDDWNSIEEEGVEYRDNGEMICEEV